MNSSPALDVALAYHRAWTGGDFERAMTYVADDIGCEAPAGRIIGAQEFRGFMGPFARLLLRARVLAAFGDEHPGVLLYDTFDRAPFDAARAEAARRTAG